MRLSACTTQRPINLTDITVAPKKKYLALYSEYMQVILTPKCYVFFSNLLNLCYILRPGVGFGYLSTAMGT